MAEEMRDAHLEALVASITAAYGGRISQEQMQRVRDGVQGLREAAAALYAYPLTNADEPDPIFAAYRGEE